MSLMSDIGAAIKLKLDKNASAMTKAQFNALAEERKANRGGSGFDEWGKHNTDVNLYPNVNQGIWTYSLGSNSFYMGRETNTATTGESKVLNPIINVNGTRLRLDFLNDTLSRSRIQLPIAPNIYPHTTTLTAEQIASGVIKHADASNSGLVQNGKGLSGTTFNQTVITVNGKKYTIEYSDNNVRKTLEITATATTYNISLSGTNITEVGMYPNDAISRSDLVFLESWHEDVSEKNFVYPLGNTQYLGGNTDGLTGITNGSFTGFETYSLFGNWQAPSALIGKGYVWSSLTEAQKKAFIANPDNNCYLDGDKIIQVRYRVRVAMGLGDNWDYPVAIIDGAGSDPVGATISYSSTAVGNKYLKPKGKKVVILQDVTAYNVNDTGFFANKNYKNITTGYESGASTAIATNNTSLDNNVAYEGKCYALPIALVHRRNQGLHHPVYNPNGTKKASDGNFWYNTAVSFTSTLDCFDQSKLLAASGYMGTVSGRPDGLFYDQVHEGDITDLRNSSKKVEDYNRLINREFNKLVAGTTRGKEGEVQVHSVQNRVLNIGQFSDSNNTKAYIIQNADIVGLPIQLINGEVHNYSISIIIKTGVDAGKVLSARSYFKLDNTYFALGNNINAPSTLLRYTDGSIPAALTGQTVDIYIAYKATRTKSNTLVYCDIIGKIS